MSNWKINYLLEQVKSQEQSLKSNIELSVKERNRIRSKQIKIMNQVIEQQNEKS